MLTEKHGELLEKRGIDLELATRLGWRSATKKGGGDWIAIPYFRGEDVVGTKYRRIFKSDQDGDENFYQDKGSEQCFYNLGVLEGMPASSPLVITEGEIDCLMALQAGMMAVSVPAGAPDSPIEDAESTKFNFLKDLPTKCTVILAVDNDHAGRVLLQEIAKRVGRARCQWVPYPKGCKDLNDTWVKFGRKGVQECFKRAEWMVVDGVYKMSALPPVPDYPALHCGIDGMREKWLLRLGDVSVVTGIPSHGKTTLVNEVICNMVNCHNWKVGIASFEQSPKTDHRRYLRTYFLKKPANLVPEESEKMLEADKWIDDNFAFIVPDIEQEDLVTLDWTLECASAAVTRHGINMLVIDPWNEMDHPRAPGMTLTEYTAWAIKQLRRFAKKWLVHIIIVAHPAKLEKNKDGGYYIPTLYDISDSAHWYNKPDIGLIVYRTDTMLTTVRIQKCRYEGMIGQVGDIDLRYDTYLGTFWHMTLDEIREHQIRFYANHPNMNPPQGLQADVELYQVEHGLTKSQIKGKRKSKAKFPVVKDNDDDINAASKPPLEL